MARSVDQLALESLDVLINLHAAQTLCSKSSRITLSYRACSIVLPLTKAYSKDSWNLGRSLSCGLSQTARLIHSKPRSVKALKAFAGTPITSSATLSISVSVGISSRNTKTYRVQSQLVQVARRPPR